MGEYPINEAIMNFLNLHVSVDINTGTEIESKIEIENLIRIHLYNLERSVG